MKIRGLTAAAQAKRAGGIAAAGPLAVAAGGEDPAAKTSSNESQATFAIFSAATFMRPESGAMLSLASLIIASVFFEP